MGPRNPNFSNSEDRRPRAFAGARCSEVEAIDVAVVHEADFRAKYLKRFPKFVGNMGVVYTGNGYDIVQYLKRSWEATKKPEDFEANCKWIRENPYRGVCGMMNMNNEFQEALHFPDNGFGNQAAELEKGMSQLYVQVQDGHHKIIWPNEIAESKLRPSPWW